MKTESIGPIRYQYEHLSSSGTVSITSVPTLVHSIAINEAWTGTVSVYAGTASPYSGTLAIIDTSSANTYIYDAELSSGLTVVVDGTPGDATLSYTKI